MSLSTILTRARLGIEAPLVQVVGRFFQEVNFRSREAVAGAFLPVVVPGMEGEADGFEFLCVAGARRDGEAFQSASAGETVRAAAETAAGRGVVGEGDAATAVGVAGCGVDVVGPGRLAGTQRALA